MKLRSVELHGSKLCKIEEFGQGCGDYLSAVAYKADDDVYSRNNVCIYNQLIIHVLWGFI